MITPREQTMWRDDMLDLILEIRDLRLSVEKLSEHVALTEARVGVAFYQRTGVTVDERHAMYLLARVCCTNGCPPEAGVEE